MTRVGDVLWWRRLRRHDRQALHVLLVLGVTADAYLRDLMRATGLSRAAVYRALARLGTDGYVCGRLMEPAGRGGEARMLYWGTAAGAEAARRMAADLAKGNGWRWTAGR